MKRPIVSLLLSLSCLGLAACATGQSELTASPAADRKEVLAPIESAEIKVRESSPPQYTLHVVSGLPSGCARFSRIDVQRQGTTIDVKVLNSVPADDNVMCTMLYGTARNSAPLGSGFRSGTTYEVRVNNQRTILFTAQ